MRRIIFAVISAFLLLSGTCFLNCRVSAAGEAEETSELKKQVEALQKRVAELEAEKNDNSNKQDAFSQEWSPLDEMSRIQEQMSKVFQDSFARGGQGGSGIFSGNLSVDPGLEFKETDDGYQIKFDMKDWDKDKVDFQVQQHSLTIRGQKARQERQEGENRYLNAQSFGTFVRTVPLPEDADTTKVKTEKENDEFIIFLPKKSIDKKQVPETES